MNQKATETNEFQSTNLFILIWKWKIHIAIVAVVVAIASMVFSSPSFIKPRYESNVVLFPPITNSISSLTITENPYSLDAIQFGEEEETEQLLQLLSSRGLKDKVIAKFDLLKHYGLDSNVKSMKAKLYGTYNDNIKISRTQYMAVEIEVTDTDPILAADIANAIPKMLDTIKSEIQNQRAKVAHDIAKKEYFKLKEQIELYEDTLDNLKMLGITDYPRQSERYEEQYAIAVRQNSKASMKALEEKLDILHKYGTQYDRVTAFLWKERNRLYEEVKRKYEETKVNSENIIPASFVVEEAGVSDKKSYPVRWLIVVIATISSVILSLLIIASIEYFRRIKDNFKNA